MIVTFEKEHCSPYTWGTAIASLVVPLPRLFPARGGNASISHGGIPERLRSPAGGMAQLPIVRPGYRVRSPCNWGCTASVMTFHHRVEDCSPGQGGTTMLVSEFARFLGCSPCAWG